MEVLSHPFRLAQDGTAATVLEGSTDANAEAIALLVQTRKGEREFVPGYGTSDPAYAGLDVAEINAALATYGLDDVAVTTITVDYPDDRTAAIAIEFEDRQP